MFPLNFTSFSFDEEESKFLPGKKLCVTIDTVKRLKRLLKYIIHKKIFKKKKIPTKYKVLGKK